MKPTRWIIAWILLTAFGSLLHAAVWNPPRIDGSALPLAPEGLLKILNNFLQMLILPAWGFVWRFLGRYQDIGATIVANTLGWGMWVIAARAVVALRRPAPTRVEHEPTMIDQPASDSPSDTLHRAAPRHVATIDPPDHAEATSDALSRRGFIGSLTLTAGACGVATAAGVGSLIAPWRLELTRYTIPIRGLPAAFDGLRVVQISDTHLGPRIPRSHVRSAIERAIALRPDLIALTGDYIHMGSWYIKPAAELFAEFIRTRASRFGVVAVMGNHDHYGGAEMMTRELQAVGIRTIDNDRVFINPPAVAERSSASNHPPEILTEDPASHDALCIAGVGDLLEGVVDIDRALRGLSDDTPRILLAHHPDTAEEIAGRCRAAGRSAPRVDLQLSGHTHGGQISVPGFGPPIVPSAFGRRYAYGNVRSPLGDMIVTSGVGMSILPVRAGVPPEIVEITLKRSES